MKRNKHLTKKKNYLGIIISVVILVILALVIFSGNKDTTTDVLLEESEQETSQPVLEEVLLEDEPTIETIKEESVAVSGDKVGEKGLCEDYFFEQGDALDILKHTIRVDKIGANALRLNVDGENYVMSDDDSEYAGDGIRLSIAKNAILYFAGDDPNNAVMIRVGCKYDVDPNEKYVKERGESICEQIYEDCQSSFDIEE